MRSRQKKGKISLYTYVLFIAKGFAEIWSEEAEGTPLLRNPRRDGPPFLHWDAAAGCEFLSKVTNAENLRHFTEDRELHLILGAALHLDFGRLTQITDLLNHEGVALWCWV